MARPMQMRSQRARQRGSILPLVALALVIAGGGAVLLGRLGEAAVARAAAQTAADAAALAGAAEGEQAAREVASANRATVVRYEVLGDDTRVRVRVGPAEAVGRARASRASHGARPGP
jgi:hypothetical protein